jgi:hypothetical protein
MSEPNVIEAEAPAEANPVVADKASAVDHDDAILDRLLSRDDEPEAIEEPDEAPAPVEPRDEIPVATIASPDREKWAGVLKRDGVPEQVIMSADDATLRAWADKASKRQKDVDGYGKKMAELEKQLKAKAGTEPPGEDDDLEDDVDVEPSKPTAEAQEAEDPFSEVTELLGEEAAKPLKAMRAELAELRTAQQKAAEQSLMSQVDTAVSWFTAQYGGKSPTRESVIAEMDRLGASKPGTYPTVMHLAQEAFSSLAGKVASPAQARKATQPTAVRGVSRSERPKTPFDAEDAILDALLEGKTRDEAVRLTRK